VTPRFLQAVLRSLADAGAPADDGELLRRFIAEKSEAAFAELVRRHGRLVWAVCRHLTRADAEADDAFQATFLVLLQNAGKIRDPARLSAWLHGVAYKVCAKARQTAERRATRERAHAAREGNGAAVPESAWDRALAAVHEEAARLPENLRVPFVLCCLEGKGVSEAAAQLGWKLGTFSGRLTRAKDLVLARLDARWQSLGPDLAPQRRGGRLGNLGAIAGVGLALPPAAALAKAAALARTGFIVPGSILQLTQGAIGMSMKSMKLLAAAVVVTCGLGLGAGWLTTAAAQTQAPTAPAPRDPNAEVRRLQAALMDALRAAQRADDDRTERKAEQQQREITLQLDAVLAEVSRKPKGETPTARTKKWEYDFVVVSDMGQSKFVEFLQDRENRGWEYNGQTTLRHDSKPTAIWVFRRPAVRTPTAAQYLNEYYRQLGERVRPEDIEPTKPSSNSGVAPGAAAATAPRASDPRASTSAQAADAARKLEALQVEIERLQRDLKRLDQSLRVTP
jgi:RNA polymerase sigma factor (sigma-70 family)